MHLALLPLHVEGLPAMLGMVEEHDALADLHLIPCLHGPLVRMRGQSCHAWGER